jgi:hypothetical protein
VFSALLHPWGLLAAAHMIIIVVLSDVCVRLGTRRRRDL